jgi:hypothetical protein
MFYTFPQAMPAEKASPINDLPVDVGATPLMTDHSSTESAAAQRRNWTARPRLDRNSTLPNVLIGGRGPISSETLFRDATPVSALLTESRGASPFAVSCQDATQMNGAGNLQVIYP